MISLKVLGNGYERVNDALERAGTETIYLGTKNEVIGYYQQEYGKHWGRELAKKIVETTGQGRVDTIARRFRGTRAGSGKVTPRAAAEYRAVGKTLPGTEVPRKDLAGKRAKVNFKGEVKISDDKRTRSFDTTLSGRQAGQLRRGNIGAIFEAYGVNPGAVETLSVDRIDVNYL